MIALEKNQKRKREQVHMEVAKIFWIYAFTTDELDYLSHDGLEERSLWIPA